MPDMKCRVKRVGLRIALLWGILGLIALLPATVWARGHIVNVQPPNGVDDTANIQGALDACVAYGPGCTVQLAAGTYLTKQLVAYNFQGTFKGTGTSSTTIQALYPLPVNIPDSYFDGECMPNSTTCLWPSLIIFVDGNIEVSDLSLMELAPPGTATTGWFIDGSEYTDLLDGIRFMGKKPTYVSIDRIAVEGSWDGSPTSLLGFNVVNGVVYTGELPRSSKPFDYYFLSGTLTVRNSSFNTTDVGVGQDGFLKNTLATLGGASSAGNVFENLFVGMDIEASQSSVFNISYNSSSGIWYSMWVVPWLSVFVPSKPSQYFIHDNQFTPTGSYSGGVYLWNDPTNPWIQATVYHNTIEPQSTLWDGIGAYNTKGAAIWNNTITGSGADAIGLWGTTLSAVTKNNVADFTLDPTYGLAQIYLDPATSYDLVVCSNSTDTVLDQGTKNKVIGCALEEATAPTTSTPRPNHPRRKLSPPQ
jgi:hypothetical protein